MTTLKQKLFPSSAARLERLPAVLARTGLSRSTIYKKMAEGDFPRAVKLSERAVAWSAAAVTHWINNRVSGHEAG